MKQRDLRDYLQDILDAINDVENFTHNLTYDQFKKDAKTTSSFADNLQTARNV